MFRLHADPTEVFLLSNVKVHIDIAQNGRLDEVPLGEVIRLLGAAGDHACALIYGPGDVLADGVRLLGIDERAEPYVQRSPYLRLPFTVASFRRGVLTFGAAPRGLRCRWSLCPRP